MNNMRISKYFFIFAYCLTYLVSSAAAITLDDFVTGQEAKATEVNQKVSNSISSGEFAGQQRTLEAFFGARKHVTPEPDVTISSGYGYSKEHLFFKNYNTSGMAVVTWQAATQTPLNLYSGDACAFILEQIQAYIDSENPDEAPTVEYPITITLLDSNNAQKAYSFKLSKDKEKDPTILKIPSMTIPFAHFLGNDSFNFASVVRITIQIESECPWAYLWIKRFGTNENDKSCMPECVETDNSGVIDQLSALTKQQQRINNTLVRCFVRRTEKDRGACRTRYQRQFKAAMANTQAAIASISATTLLCPPHPLCVQTNANGLAVQTLSAEARNIYRAYRQLTKCYWRSVDGGICNRPLVIRGVARVRPNNCPGNVCGDCSERVDTRRAAIRKLSRQARTALRQIISLAEQIPAESSICE